MPVLIPFIPLIIAAGGAIAAGVAEANSDDDAPAPAAKPDPAKMEKYDDPNVTGGRVINREAYFDPRASERNTELGYLQNTTRDREAAQATAAQRSQVATSQGVGIGQAAQAAGASMGDAQRANGGGIARTDNDFRKGQMDLIGELQRTASGKGPSLVQQQMEDAQDRSNAQRLGAVTAVGGPVGLAMRNASLAKDTADAQLARDVGQARMQEQQGARAQLAGLLAQGRGQDINVNTAAGQLATQESMANMSEANRFALQRAGLFQQNNQFNADGRNRFAIEQGHLDQQNMQFNAGAYNDMHEGNFNADQTTRLANLDAEYRQRGMDDAQTRAYLAMKLQERSQDVDRAMAYERDMTTQDMSRAGLDFQYGDLAQRGTAMHQQNENSDDDRTLGYVRTFADTAARTQGNGSKW